ncbi:MAG: NAD-dependent epimerase/dehydratase family protein [Verrucomicrobia bacterium]|nr:NAD-dependent epimerase/dehydratase family protein [Verrucomicrobiota bacterium]MBU4429448.1 NAD-dependent epimerase/dehydratase family protein [Verrucomicrobiota bacterium]MCG2679951.1 NAD-dependent epimerase/dehydratase family protein [Kiritimatiellia bacterium]
MNILVTGATGAVGPSVVQALCKAGYAVRSFSLDRPLSGVFPLNVDEQIGDVTDKPAVQSAMQGVDAVVHLAALLHIVNPPPELRAKYEQINVGGTETVVEAAVKAGVKRVVLASTIAVYGPSNGQILNEDSDARPDTFYAQTKLAAEKIVLNARSADYQPIGTVLRFGAVYGARIKGNYERLVRALARSRFIPIGTGQNRRTLAYDRDVARAVVLAVQQPAAGKIYNVTDGQFHKLNEIITAICEALGRKPPRFSIPVDPSRAVAGMIEDAMRLIGRDSPISRAMIDKYTEDIAVDGKRLQYELGFVPQYDLDAGWRETVQEMRQMDYPQRTPCLSAGDLPPRRQGTKKTEGLLPTE